MSFRIKIASSLLLAIPFVPSLLFALSSTSGLFKKEPAQMSPDPNYKPFKVSDHLKTNAESTATPAQTTESAPQSIADVKITPTDSATTGNAQITNARGPSKVKLSLECAQLESASAGPSEVAADTAIALGKICGTLKTADESCDGIFSGDYGVNRICHTENNESIATSITMIQTLMSVASGVTNACSNFGKAMDLAKKAMTLYTTACTAAQVACNSKCGTAYTALQNYNAAIKKGVATLQSGCKAEMAQAQAANLPAQAVAIDKHCMQVYTVAMATSKITEADASPTISPTGAANKSKICSISVPAMLGTAIINLGSLAQSKAQSDQCKEDAAAKQAAADAEKSCTNVANKDRPDCACTIAANKTLSYCATNMVDCGLSENADKPLCICKANPRMKGCEGVSTSLATNSTLNSGSGGGLSSSRNPGSLVNTPATANDAANFPKSTSGNGQDGVGSAAGGGSGGSSAGLSSSSGGGDAAQKAAEKAAGKDSANILESGGAGGGGFRSSGFGGGYSSPDYRSKLKAFASKNGIGAKIAGSSWNDQVTATGGKSNFEKVKTRYQENKSSLLAK